MRLGTHPVVFWAHHKSVWGSNTNLQISEKLHNCQIGYINKHMWIHCVYIYIYFFFHLHTCKNWIDLFWWVSWSHDFFGVWIVFPPTAGEILHQNTEASCNLGGCFAKVAQTIEWQKWPGDFGWNKNIESTDFLLIHQSFFCKKSKDLFWLEKSPHQSVKFGRQIWTTRMYLKKLKLDATNNLVCVLHQNLRSPWQSGNS